VPLVDLSTVSIEPEVISLIPAQFALKYCLIGLKKENDKLTVVLRNPFDITMTDELKAFTGCPVDFVLATKQDIQEAIKKHYGTGAATVEKLVTGSKTQDRQGVYEDTVIDQDHQGVSEASLVNYVNQILLEAHENRATDIHIEPFSDRLRIRYRVDGMLHDAKTPQDIKELHNAIISRFKVMANLNISEKRRPQDGRCKVILNSREIDLRLATYPSMFGEGISIRLLRSTSTPISIDELGMSQEHLGQLKEIINKPNGIVLVTGPTGCGKSTSLYAFVNHINA